MARSTLKVKRRVRLGKVGSKQVRNEGKIPAVIYGKGSESIPLIIDPSELKKALATESGRNTLLDLEIDDDGKVIKKFTLLKDIQIDYVSQKPIHLDFQVVTTDQKVTVEIPISLVGRAEGMKEGGILEESIRELVVECIPENIPNVIEFDISDLLLGEGVHIRDLVLPEGVEALGNPDDLIASIQVPRAMVTETSAVSEEDEEGEEVEGEEVEGEEGEAAEEAPKEESESGDGEG